MLLCAAVPLVLTGDKPSPLSSVVQEANVDASLSFLDARGVNVQGLSADGTTESCSVLVSLCFLVVVNARRFV